MDRREHNHMNNSFTPPGGSSHWIVFATRFATLPHHGADTKPEIPGLYGPDGRGFDSRRRLHI